MGNIKETNLVFKFLFLTLIGVFFDFELPVQDIATILESIVSKCLKLSKIGFSMKHFRGDFLQFSHAGVKILILVG